MSRFENICLGGCATGMKIPTKQAFFEVNTDCYYRYPFQFGDEVYYNFVCSNTPLEYARRLLLELIIRKAI